MVGEAQRTTGLNGGVVVSRLLAAHQRNLFIFRQLRKWLGVWPVFLAFGTRVARPTCGRVPSGTRNQSLDGQLEKTSFSDSKANGAGFLSLCDPAPSGPGHPTPLSRLP